MRNEASIEIDRPIEEVFQLTNDCVAQWSIVVVEDEVIEKTPEGVGTKFRSVTEDRGKRMEFQGVVTAYDPPRHSTVEMTGDYFDIQADYRFEDLSGKTRATQVSHVTGKGMFKVMMFLFGWLMNKSSCDALQKELESLKKFCESQTSDSH